MSIFYTYKEVGKIAEKVMKLGSKTGDTYTVDADAIGLNLIFDHLCGVTVDWTIAETNKMLMIKITAPRLGLTGRIHVRKMTAQEIADLN